MNLFLHTAHCAIVFQNGYYRYIKAAGTAVGVCQPNMSFVSIDVIDVIMLLCGLLQL